MAAVPAPAELLATTEQLVLTPLLSPLTVTGEEAPLADTLPGFDASPRLFVLAPAGTPAAVVARLDAAIKAMLARPAVQEALSVQGATVAPAGAEELGAIMVAEVRKWGAVARESGAKAQ